MNSAALPSRPGKRNVDPFVLERLAFRVLLNLPETFFDLFLEQLPQAVQLFTGARPFLRGKIFQTAEHRSQSPAATQRLDADFLDLRLGVAMINSLQHLVPKSFQR